MKKLVLPKSLEPLKYKSALAFSKNADGDIFYTDGDVFYTDGDIFYTVWWHLLHYGDIFYTVINDQNTQNVVFSRH